MPKIQTKKRASSSSSHNKEQDGTPAGWWCCWSIRSGDTRWYFGYATGDGVGRWVLWGRRWVGGGWVKAAIVSIVSSRFCVWEVRGRGEGVCGWVGGGGVMSSGCQSSQVTSLTGGQSDSGTSVRRQRNVFAGDDADAPREAHVGDGAVVGQRLVCGAAFATELEGGKIEKHSSISVIFASKLDSLSRNNRMVIS